MLQGEIWAETTFMGFKWHFYACMQGEIYEITDWVVCQVSWNAIALVPCTVISIAVPGMLWYIAAGMLHVLNPSSPIIHKLYNIYLSTISILVLGLR